MPEWNEKDVRHSVAAAAGAVDVASAPAQPEVIITVDYEVYDFIGSNRVDVHDQMLRPTDAMMQVCERHGATLTIMFEIGAYFLFRQHAPQLAREIEAQLQDAVARGHDVQLHLHPHLLPECGAQYYPRRSTVWFRKYQRIHEPLARDPHLLRRCKETCEELLRPVDSSYEVVAFRAGKYQVQPHAAIYQALAEAGFLAASNVVRGRYLRDYGGELGHDYRTAWTGCHPYFPSADNIGWPTDNPDKTVLEMPVCVDGDVLWSFDALDGESLARVFHSRSSDNVPLVMLGHSKGTTTRKLRALDEGLSRIADIGNVGFSSLSQAARKWFRTEHDRRESAWEQAVESHLVSCRSATERLSKAEHRQLEQVDAAIRRRLADGRPCAIGVFGCGTGYALLLPLAAAFRENRLVTFFGHDSDPMAVRFAQHVAARWGLRNVRFEATGEGTLDITVAQGLYHCEDLNTRHARAAKRHVKRNGHMIRSRRRPRAWTKLRTVCRHLALGFVWRVHPLARLINRTIRALRRRRSSDDSQTLPTPMPRLLREKDSQTCTL